MIPVSDTVQALVALIDEFSGHRLQDGERFSVFLQHAHDSGKTEIVAELAFEGKYISGLVAAARKETAEGEHFDKLESEMIRSIREFREKLGLLVEDAEPSFREIADRHYLGLDETVTGHILALAGDFSWLKNWELAMKEVKYGE